MNTSDFSIYPISFGEKRLQYEVDYTVRPIVAGAALLHDAQKAECKKAGYLLDDVGGGSDLSVYNLNWGELSAVYWLLKNASESVIGHAHYRRAWKSDFIRNSEDGVLYVPPRVNLPQGMALGEQFELINYQSNAFVRKYTDLTEKGRVPLMVSQVNELWSLKYIHPCLMSLGPRDYYVRYMSVLFDCLFPFWEEYKSEIIEIQGYKSRVMAYLAERLMTGLLLHKEYFFGVMPIKFGGMQLAPVQ